jgi:hypothetical protein
VLQQFTADRTSNIIIAFRLGEEFSEHAKKNSFYGENPAQMLIKSRKKSF